MTTESLKELSDEQLLRRLRRLKIPLKAEGFIALARRHPDLERLIDALPRKSPLRERHRRAIWPVVEELRRRLVPELRVYEAFVKRVEEGKEAFFDTYELSDAVAAWEAAWEQLRDAGAEETELFLAAFEGLEPSYTNRKESFSVWASDFCAVLLALAQEKPAEAARGLRLIEELLDGFEQHLDEDDRWLLRGGAIPLLALSGELEAARRRFLGLSEEAPGHELPWIRWAQLLADPPAGGPAPDPRGALRLVEEGLVHVRRARGEDWGLGDLRDSLRVRTGEGEPIDWERAVAGVPTDDYLEGNLDDPFTLEERLESFLWALEEERFLCWEAVIRQEQGLPLAGAHREALEGLLSFSDDPGPILTINDIERPQQPWYAILRALTPRLLVEPLKTAGSHYQSTTETWPRLAEMLEDKAEGLSLPEGASAPLEVLTSELRGRLWLQSCCDPLLGIGQMSELTLASEDQSWRIEEFIELLQRHADALEGLALTLERLRQAVQLPPGEQERFERLLSEALALSGPTDRILPHLERLASKGEE